MNDTFDHAAGDALIRIVADRLRAAINAELTFSLGGDEFAVIVAKQELDLVRTANEILEALALPAHCDGHIVFPAATFGGAVPGDGLTADQTRRNADVALYHAKENNGGQYRQFTPSWQGVDETVPSRSRCSSCSRMTTTLGNVITVAHFHEATKDAHVAAELTQRMVTRVARDIRSWLDARLPLQHVGINLFAANFRGGAPNDQCCSKPRSSVVAEGIGS